MAFARPAWVDALVWLACVASLVLALEHGYEGAWYPLGTIMHHPDQAAGPFGHRVLFPCLAVLFEKFVPRLTDYYAFFTGQTLIACAVVYLSGLWARTFFPALGRPLGYALTALMVAPTVSYWTFYDLAIVGFWTACFLLLGRDRYLAYLAVFALAALNHENILLLAPCAVVYSRGRMKPSRLALFGAAQVVLWLAVRAAVLRAVPGPASPELHLAENLAFWQSYGIRTLLLAAAVLVPWWLIALRGWRRAARILQAGLLAWPGLFVVTTLFGRYAEARQFVAFVPVCVGLIAAQAQRAWETPRPA